MSGNKIYTKAGDSGITSLGNCELIAKNSPLVDAIGAVDELNSHIGFLCAVGDEDPMLVFIQESLFTIGMLLANPDHELNSNPDLLAYETYELEFSIDIMTNQLPELKNFILPGGNQIGAYAQVCRSVCRRAERAVQSYAAPGIKQYLNRLSDYFFTYSRWINYHEGYEEQIWKNN